MLLIFSEEYEMSTDEVIDWLHYFKRPFTRFNETNHFAFEEAQLIGNNWQIILTKGADKIDLEAISHYWYRRGYFHIEQKAIKTLNKGVNDQLDTQIGGELYKIEELIHSRLKDMNHIGSYVENYLNKLNILRKAILAGLKVPNTMITSNRQTALRFCNSHNRNVITKAIRERLQVNFAGMNYYANTTLLNYDTIKRFPSKFTPALFQECLLKKYELRIFYLDEICYSSAIFSQNDHKTAIDFRNYNHDKPNRVCPYILPTEVSIKLCKLMTSLGFRSGSIDMVVDVNQEYIFLEVNPIGQFKQVSAPCNYHLEKLIFSKLTCPN